MADITQGADGSFMEKYLTPIAVIVGALIIAGAFAFGGAGGGTQNPAALPAQEVNIADVKADTSPSIGSADAPVTMAVWFDYTCPHCINYENTTLTELSKTYVANGQLRIVYKDFQFRGPASTDTALYSRAVWEAAPEKWGEWVKTVFANEAAIGDNTALDGITSGLGIDVATVDGLLASNKAAYTAAIEADKAEGMSFGINGTPGTIIGTTFLGGSQPLASISAAIDAELAK